MAFVVRSSARKVLSSQQLLSVLFNRNFKMSAQLRAEEALEKMKKKNPYYEKYASKIATLQQSSPEEFLNRLEAAEGQQIAKATETQRYTYFQHFLFFFFNFD